MPGRMAQWGNDLYTGKRSYDIVGSRRRWFGLAIGLVAASLLLLLTIGLNLGIAFRGGSEFTVPGASTTAEQPAIDAVARIEGAQPPRVSVVGERTIRVQTSQLDDQQTDELAGLLADAYGVGEAEIGSSFIGATWGADVTSKALRGLVIFLALVSLVLTLYFRDWRMALAGIVALLHDVAITVGVYAVVGWEVTPATVIGFLTILGYSLYDAVVVFDMIKEVTKPLGPTSRTTYSEAANQALSSTLVRSLNTSLVAILPVGAILFIGTTLFGAGTLKDLSLALFVGMIVGTYSSICVATPLLVQFKEREPKYKQIRQNIARREQSSKRSPKARVKAGAGASAATEDDLSDDAGEDDRQDTPDIRSTVTVRKVVQSGSRQQPKRGSRQQRRGGK